MTTNSIKIRSVQFLGRDGWVQLSKVGGEDSRWDMPVAMEGRSYAPTIDELLGSRRSRGEVIKQQSDEIDGLRAALEWYGQEAAAAARYMANKEANPDALLAILTVLANDGGSRADKALENSSDSEAGHD